MTLQESKDSTAANNHYVNWGLVLQLSVDGSLNKEKLDALVNEAAELYARSENQELEEAYKRQYQANYQLQQEAQFWKELYEKERGI